ncbi:NAD(P)H-dependent oxidoreductase [uncultured Sulfitobacter sp.]|uniref:NAD(P)H-dependent oxidoreductase n=1 Tax=uncultured Sulfitobacter sp. TaxID=191468 RepID=UPI003459D57D
MDHPAIRTQKGPSTKCTYTSSNDPLTSTATTALFARGDTVTVSDLNQSHFNPVEPAEHYRGRADMGIFTALNEQRNASRNGHSPAAVKDEIAAVEQVDLLVFQFPLSWHRPPAIVKGWMNRVFVDGGF